MLKQEQPDFPLTYVFYKKLMSFLYAGRILHCFFLSALVLLIFCLNRLASAEHWYLSWYLVPVLFLTSFLVTTQLDAYSRYQNYKFVKDLLYKHGFRELLLKPFAHSRCQRDAAFEASKQLNYSIQTNQYYKKLGYRWYHILPTAVVRNPMVLLQKGFWITTFFVPHYESKYFYW